MQSPPTDPQILTATKLQKARSSHITFLLPLLFGSFMASTMLSGAETTAPFGLAAIVLPATGPGSVQTSAPGVPSTGAFFFFVFITPPAIVGEVKLKAELFLNWHQYSNYKQLSMTRK